MFHNTEEWKITPLDGNTGQAYMGINKDEKIFFKRNTSPFLAALAAEGITPKLKWTQTTYSGDILTAQEWKEGSHLNKEDMGSQAVIGLIKSIHENESLLNLLVRAKAQRYYPQDLLMDYYHDLPISLQKHEYFHQVLSWLDQQIDQDFMNVDFVVCHGDLNHNNFLFTSEQELYLVDWDSVKIADPLFDITLLLCRYFQPSEWMDWFAAYEFKRTDSFYKRVKWYSLLACLIIIKQYFSEDRNYQLNETVLLLRNIFDH